MKTKFFDKNGVRYEVRVQERKVVETEIRRHGEVVAEGIAIQNPKDRYSPKLGAEISLSRALKALNLKEGKGVERLGGDDWRDLRDEITEEFLALREPTEEDEIKGAIGMVLSNVEIGLDLALGQIDALMAERDALRARIEHLEGKATQAAPARLGTSLAQPEASQSSRPSGFRINLGPGISIPIGQTLDDIIIGR